MICSTSSLCAAVPDRAGRRRRSGKSGRNDPSRKPPEHGIQNRCGPSSMPGPIPQSSTVPDGRRFRPRGVGSSGASMIVMFGNRIPPHPSICTSKTAGERREASNWQPLRSFGIGAPFEISGEIHSMRFLILSAMMAAFSLPLIRCLPTPVA